ncbi:glycosyltransferase [Peribacillus sp. SCS-26]|uniref:glycosyltransferase n=1 Tax=Paraperibacillus marinus TaxID=3115295 RepID=UPI0039069BD7
MRKIAYYISDYGYGHAARSAAIIQRWIEEDKELSVVICHFFALDFLKGFLTDERIFFRDVQTDIGYVLEKDSIMPDVTALTRKFNTFIYSWPKRIAEEAAFLNGENIDLVLSDISPIAFEAASSAGIPSAGISNFTWYSAYEDMVDREKLEPFRKAYSKMTYQIRLAGSREENWSDGGDIEAGFFSRKVDWEETDRIKRSLNQQADQHIIFFGLGMKIDVGSLNQLPLWRSENCHFIVSHNTNIEGRNITRIPRDYMNSQNYIAAADLAITKAGWGTIGECITGNTPLLIIDRPCMAEDQNTISYLLQYQLCRTMEWEKFERFKITDSFVHSLKQELHNSSYEKKDELGNIILALKNILANTEEKRVSLV